MPRPLVIAINALIGAAAAAIMISALIGPGSARAHAQIFGSTTSPLASITTITGSTRTTPPPTSRATTTIPTATTAHATTTASTSTTVFPPQTKPAPTTTTTSTTIAPIGSHFPVPPSTLPLATKAQNAHVSPVFAALSGAGFFVALLIMGVRYLQTRPSR